MVAQGWVIAPQPLLGVHDETTLPDGAIGIAHRHADQLPGIVDANKIGLRVWLGHRVVITAVEQELVGISARVRVVAKNLALVIDAGRLGRDGAGRTYRNTGANPCGVVEVVDKCLCSSNPRRSV